MLDMSVKSVRLEEIMDYINPKVAFIKVDAEGKDCLVISIVESRKKEYFFWLHILLFIVFHF